MPNESCNPKNWETSETLSAKEVGRYSWHRGFFPKNWDKRVYQRNMDELRKRDVALFALGPIRGESVLDVGCGAGIYALTFLKLGASYVAGQDLSEGSISEAREFCRENGFQGEFKSGNCIDLQFPDCKFDKVFAGDFFEHIDRPTKILVLREIYRVLKPGGVVVIKTPNLLYLRAVVWLKRIAAPFMLKNPFRIFIHHTRNNPDNEHIGLVTHSQMSAMLHECCFHEALSHYVPLRRRGLPDFVGDYLRNFRVCNTDIILAARKPIFFPIYK